MLVDAAHPRASVTVTLYIPATRFVAVAVVCPLFQRYVYGDVPPVTTTVAFPLFAPKHKGLLKVLMLAEGPAILPIVTGAVIVQKLRSVTVTVYVPATRAVALAPVCPFDQLQVYGANPPVAETVALPLAMPQLAFRGTELTARTGG
jgi:hypothetical protein